MSEIQTAEQRAKAAVDHFNDQQGWDNWDGDQLHSLIAQAIRGAEDAVLEMAAAAATGAALRALDSGYDRENTVIAVVVAVRSLRSTPSTGDRT